MSSSDHGSEAPRFSVIIPVRDDPDGLARALDSMSAQSLEDHEVVVVDDGSDPPVDLTGHPRVRLLRHAVAKGPGAARNAGVGAARGTFLAFLDSDDVFGPDRLANALRVHEAGADVVVCGGTTGVVDTSPTSVPSSVPSSVPVVAEAYLDSFTPHLGRVSVRAEVMHPFDERYLACQDVEWWCRVPTDLVVHEHPGVDHGFVGSDHPRVLHSPSARLAFSYLLLEDHPEVYAARRRALAFRMLRIADLESRLGSTRLSLVAARAALRNDPSPRTAKYLARILLGRARGAAPPVQVSTDPLPPIPRRRAALYRPFEVGGAEAALRFGTRSKRAYIVVHRLLPSGVRKRVRAFLWRRGAMTARSPYGVIPLRSAAAVHIAPVVREPLESEVFSRLVEPGSTVLDIGANNGWYTLIGAARAGRDGQVIAFEPDPRSAASMRALIELNPQHGTIRLVEAAVGDHDGEIEMVLTADPAKSHAVAGPGASSPERRRRADMVSAATMWAYLPEPSPPLVVKLDVEGLESQVIRTLFAARPAHVRDPVLMFEMAATNYERSGEDPVELMAHFAGLGYHLLLIDYRAGGLEPLHDPGQLERPSRNVVAVPAADLAGVLRRVHGRPAGALDAHDGRR
jgi:FkbM family methyltransferase